MTDRDIADRIIAHLGGSDGLTALKASHIHTIPSGLAFSVILKNPGSFHIEILEDQPDLLRDGEYYYTLKVDGSALHYGPLKFQMVAGGALLSLLEPIIWAAK